MTSFHIVVVLSAIITALAVAVYGCLWDIKQRKKENAALREAMRDAAAQLERLKEYTAKNRSIEEAANAERRELENTADGGLAGRANGLF
jgi:type II secretory pathway component PulJ